ncbi:NUDIX domain-containing protein [Cytobacillus sp. FJAT-54145]|uniref:NUDIX domain-containing protein n=1 Tax=Cytobacillus spartinae TaxID=3299023 RepID=A0ABW6KG93_9BACI
MEIWDIYDENRVKTGRFHERGKTMMDGDYHLVVHVWIMNGKGEFLIQKRQPWKKGHPNMWDCSAAGSAICGDNSEQAAIRETKEEIGIDLDIFNGEVLFTHYFSHGFDDIWLVNQEVDVKDLKLQEEEVADAKWASEEQIKEMVTNGEFIAFEYLDRFFELARAKYIHSGK